MGWEHGGGMRAGATDLPGAHVQAAFRDRDRQLAPKHGTLEMGGHVVRTLVRVNPRGPPPLPCMHATRQEAPLV